jgi:hypothetical protein
MYYQDLSGVVATSQRHREKQPDDFLTLRKQLLVKRFLSRGAAKKRRGAVGCISSWSDPPKYSLQ